jgi:signal peptidase II
MKKYMVLLIISIIVIASDQLTKAVVSERIPLHDNIVVLECCVNLTHVRNSGAAFGMFQSADPKIRVPFFKIVSVLAMLLIAFLFVKTSASETLMIYALSFIMTGAAGNFIDRIFNGYVVDFLDVYYGEYHWPSFNVADTAITIGVGLMVLDMIITSLKPALEAEAPPQEREGPAAGDDAP